MKGRKTGSKLISLILSLVMIVTLLPATVMAAPATDSSSTSANVEKVLNYAAQMRDNNTKENGDYASGGFTWDTEGKEDSWRYFNGLMMDAFLMTGDQENIAYAEQFYDTNIADDGIISDYAEGELDSVEAARGLFDLLDGQNAEKYKAAIQYVYTQLENQISYGDCGGNYQHKDSWTDWNIGLDGLYMAQPFLMECANAIADEKLTLVDAENNPVAANDIYQAVYNRMEWVATTMKDEATGLYHHGWNVENGNGHFWSRSLGWYAMAQVDIIEMMPEGTERDTMISQLIPFFDAMLNYQDSETGMWYNVTNRGADLDNNKLETSGSAMMAYALMKAYNNGYVTDAKYGEAGLKAFNGVVESKVSGDEGNYTVADIYQKSSVETSDEGYCQNEYVNDEAKGTGALIMAAILANTTADKLPVDNSDESNGSSAPTVPGNSETDDSTQNLDWKEIPGGTYYERTQSMETGREYVILYQSNGTSTSGKALHYGSKSDVNCTDVNISSQNDRYSISNIDAKTTWYVDDNNRIYCINNKNNYYIYRNNSKANLTTDSDKALSTWVIDGQDNGTVNFNMGNQTYVRGLRWKNNDFWLDYNYNGGIADLYLYEKHTSSGGQAALTGTLSYTVKTGSSLTEDQIKENASILYREGADSTETTTINWDQADVSWNTVLNTDREGTYNMTVSYQGVELGTITVEVQEKVLDKTQPNWGLNAADENYPEYPADGAVRMNKTATEQSLNDTGLTKVELDVAGISVKTGIDVVLIVDVSNSMAWSVENSGGKDDEAKLPSRGETTKLEDAMTAATEFANILLADYDDGSKTNNTISMVTFAGYDKENYKGTSDNIDSVRTYFEKVEDPQTAKNYFDSVYFTTDKGELGDGHVDYTLHFGDESEINRGNTNYDYAFWQASQAVKDIQTSYNGDYEADRETVVVFMTDGAPSHYDNERAQGSDKTPDKLPGTTTVYPNPSGNITEDSWLRTITSPNRYAKILDERVDGFYAVGFDLAHGGFSKFSWSEEELTPVLEGMVEGKTIPVTAATDRDALETFYRSLATQIRYAGTEAEVTDTLMSDVTLQMSSTIQTSTGILNLKDKEITPSIDVILYDLYAPGTTITENGGEVDVSGRRTGESETVETVTFNEDGSQAYSNLINEENNGAQTNILVNDGITLTIKAKKFTYTKEIASGVEKFEWNIGNITNQEIALSYYVYLKDSMTGGKDPGIYDTNLEATLEYVDINGNYANRYFSRPKIGWGGASTTYEFYLVDYKGRPVNHNGDPISFENRIIIGEPITKLLNQNAGEEVRAVIKAAEVMPGDYYLYDINASYTVQTSSGDSVAGSLTISDPSPDASKKTESNGITLTQTGAQTTKTVSATPTYFTQTHVAFGVRYDMTSIPSEFTLTPDQTVIDYGKAIQVDVLANDETIPNTAKATLAGFIAYNSNIDTSMIQNSAGIKSFETANGVYSIVDGKVQFKPEKFISEVDKVFCSIHIEKGEDNYYLYEELDVIPATSVYYETDFADGVFTFDEVSSWAPDGEDTISDEVQDEGKIGTNRYGYDTTYEDDIAYSNGTSYKVEGKGSTTTTANFSFTGTGFDLISRTGEDQGSIRVSIFTDAAKKNMVKSVTVRNWSETGLELYQVPVVSVENLAYGTYYVEVGVSAAYTNDKYPQLNRGGEFTFDAVRIFNPIDTSEKTASTGDGLTAYNAYVADGEADAQVSEVRNLLIDASSYDSGIVETPGMAFVDRVYGTEESGVTIADYTTIGPNNEVYLSSGQAIAFKLTSSEIPASVDVGMKAVNGSQVIPSVYIVSEDMLCMTGQEWKIASNTAQYYDLFENAESSTAEVFNSKNAYVIITNAGSDGILSITDIKVAFGENAGTVSYSVDKELESYVQSVLNVSGDGAVPDYDVKSATFTSDTCAFGKTAVLQVITTEDVEQLTVINKFGRDVQPEMLSEISENGEKIWTISIKMTGIGNQSYTVTGYGVDGTEGMPATAEIKVTLR